MKRTIFIKAIGGCLGAAMLLSFPACSDDHFDIYDGGNPTAGTTIWQNINAIPELDSLAMILSKVKVYSREDDKVRTMTYSELLNSGQTFTFWAPLNGTYNAKYYLDQIEKYQALAEEGNTTEANKLEYNLGVQFAQNHLARFTDESNRDSRSVKLFNGKFAEFDPAAGLFNKIPLSATYKDVPSSNGVMHVIEGQSPFAYNIYDYLAANSELFSTVYNTLSDPAFDKYTFNPSQSIPGGMNQNGEIEYVDSIFINNNEILNNAGAQIKNEDSLYIAVIPSDAAWEQAYKKIGGLFKYAKQYKYNYDGNGKNFPTKTDPEVWRPDSLSDAHTKMNVLTCSYFSPSVFPGDFERTDIDGILNYAYYADSIVSTNRTIFRNYAGEGQKNPLFGDVEPVIASNGILFPLPSYEYDPSYSVMERKEIDLRDAWAVGSVTGTPVKNESKFFNLVAGGNWDESIDITTLGENKAYRYFQAQGDLKIYIPLPEVYSGKYRIKVQVVPNRIDYNHKWYDKTDNTVEVMQVSRFDAQIFDDEGNAVGAAVKDNYISDDEVQTITVFESIEFPKCYAKLGLSKCYPLLELSYPATKQKRDTPKNVNSPTFALSLVKVILEPVHE